jgi:hypothetical protein
MQGIYAALLTASLTAGLLVAAGCQPEQGGEARDRAEERPAGETAVGESPGKESPVVRAPAGGDDDGMGAVTGKPTAPIDIRYRVIGTAIVGQPVSIELELRSTLHNAPITLDYRINDPRELALDESQPRRVELRATDAAGDATAARRQVTVIPQREGRVYLNVSATIETADGALVRSIAIPVQVGRGRSEPVMNGELQEDSDGEAVISMPAEN